MHPFASPSSFHVQTFSTRQGHHVVLAARNASSSSLWNAQAPTSSTQLRASSSSSSASGKPSRSEASEATQAKEEDDDSTLAFGGGAHSRGNQDGDECEARPRRKAAGETIEFVVHGSAGKGATPNYGRRRPEATWSARDGSEGRSSSNRDEAIASTYRHDYAPTSRSPRPLPHHTYFSSPSSSFNDDAAAMATGAGAVGVGGPRSGLGMGAGMHVSGGGQRIARKKSALILPGQGSQYIGMTQDVFRKYRSARHVWHMAEEALLAGVGNPRRLRELYGSGGEAERGRFEIELAKSIPWDAHHNMPGDTAVARARKGRLRDLVFSGDQLNLTRSENAQPSILVSSLSILQVLRQEFAVDLIADHIDYVAGHGLGVYAALCSTGALDMRDAVRLLRHRGLASSHFVNENKIIFPDDCQRPESIYETWAFANAGSGKGAELLSIPKNINAGGVTPTSSATDSDVVRSESEAGLQRRGWKRTQMSGCTIRPGKLQESLDAVAQTMQDIQEGRLESVRRDEVVEVANINSSLQIVLSGTRVGVSLASDRLRQLNFGARAVNLPVSGPYHSSLMQEAAEFLKPSIDALPLQEPSIGESSTGRRSNAHLVSSREGAHLLSDVDAIRSDLRGALAQPVMWLQSIERMVDQNVQRFICLGPGRACAHLLSKELAHRDRLRMAAGKEPGQFEVWSINSVEDVSTGSRLYTQRYYSNELMSSDLLCYLVFFFFLFQISVRADWSSS